MKLSGITWDNETMFNWLSNPKSVIKGAAPCQRRRHSHWPRPVAALPAPRLPSSPALHALGLSRLCMLSGTNMAFVGFKKPADSADVIAFLNKNK